MNIKLTSLNGTKVVVTEDFKYRAQQLCVEEALAGGLTLQEAVDTFDGFTEDWVEVGDVEYGWGEVTDTAIADITLFD